MYDTNQHGDVYYEVFLRFVEDLLERWREMEVTHHLTVVFFCRVYFAGNKVRQRKVLCRGWLVARLSPLMLMIVAIMRRSHFVLIARCSPGCD